MKRILNFATVSLVAFAALFISSCESEPGGGTTESGPSVTLTSSDDITVDPGATFTVDFSASKGDNPLKAVTVYEDVTKIPASRLTINGTAAAANAVLLFGDDVDGLAWSLDIVAHTAAATPITYEIEVQDEANRTSSVLITVTTSGTPPSLTTTSPTTVTVGQDIKNLFRLSATQGTGELVSIEVKESGEFVDPSNIFWQTISMAVDDNPFTLGDGEKAGFDDQELYIMTPASEGNFVYTVVLTDEFGLTAQLQFDVTTLPSGTAVDMLEGVLLNAGGGSGTGGLDLDTGMSTNSDDGDAEIRDNGIDTDLPVEQNWLRTISPIKDNGVSMKYLRAGEGGLPEGFTFAGVEFKEDLADLFNNGVDFTNDASDVVMIEDVFIVEREGRYWVLEVIEIVTDPSGNEDSYKFDVKY